MGKVVRKKIPKVQEWLSGGGEMGKLIRAMDWSKSPLGPIEGWPQSLRTTVSLCLASNFPISIAWGPKHTQIYNDGYWPICGGKHPRSMGQDFTECWASALPVIGEAFNRALAGETSYLENQRMFLDRKGYLEETFFTFSFSPIRDETGGVGGLFHPATETTSKMLVERRTRALRELAERTGKAKTVDEALTTAAEVLGNYPLDVPFLLLYALPPDGQAARLVGSVGLSPGNPVTPAGIDLEARHFVWPLGEVARSGVSQDIDLTGMQFPPCGPYPDPLKLALALPIPAPGLGHPAAILIAGASSRLPFDDMYRGFYEQVAAIVTTAVANARAYAEAELRAEKLAALDRAKTLFFSNVSHELRTPLTLIMGPLEDTLARPRDLLPAEVHESITLAHRNSLRLLKLVNILLDFSRIEAGRFQADFRPADLATLTAHLAGVFRSAIEKAGLELVVACDPLPKPVYVDLDMWEKIVLNLLSNAFKFTLQGRITMRLRQVGDHAELAVEDTGCGIPENELGNVFQRFHRIEGTRGRTHEGTGIGLALVEELVKIQGGNIKVASAVGRGTTFTVSLPFGKTHLPGDRIGAGKAPASTGIGTDAYVEEALSWLPDAEGVSVESPLAEEVPGTGAPAAGKKPHLLVADDNADMREYLRKLLSLDYVITTAADGEAAWRSLRERRPDLLLTDVMMPALDGFGLLARVRADAKTRSIPVIMVSARAGEESRVEGLSAGADDYLVKPFSARELKARVRANLELARLRQESARLEERFEAKKLAHEELERLVTERTGQLRENSAKLRKQNEELSDLNRRLEEEAAARSAAQNAAAAVLADLERSNRELELFASVTSHDLQEPLHTITSFTELLESEYRGKLDQDADTYLGFIVDAASYMHRMINDLLAYSRVGTRAKPFAPVKMDAALDQALTNLANTMAESKAKIDRDELPEVQGDEVQLAQLFQNLLGNAIKFRKKDAALRIGISCERGDGEWLFRVRDNGIGIDPRYFDSVFEIFRRLHTREEYEGSGMGLAICRKIVSRHGGRIWVESAPGEGTSFYFTLPANGESHGS